LFAAPDIDERELMRPYQADIDRYRTSANESSLSLILRHQGLWALGVHRFFHPLVTSNNLLIRKLGKMVGFVASKWIEIVAGISLNPRTEVGAGLYIGHFGNIIIHPDVIIGHHCVIMQGVTIGNSGRVKDASHHVPQLGNRVYVGTGAVITGTVTLGNDCVVGANAVVNKSLPARAVAMGAPAEVISYKGSFQYIHYSGMDDDEERIKSFKLARDAVTQARINTKPIRDTATMRATMGSQP
jgi:serine O-acetyltransferase